MYNICFRYLNQITVRDIQTNQVWHFVCNDWLSPLNGSKSVARTLNVHSNTGSNAYHFSLKSMQDMRSDHHFVSILSPPPQSMFTRVRRLSCVMSFIMLAMLTAIMLYGQPPAELEESALGMVVLNWQQLRIAIQSLSICVPTSMLVVFLFTNVQPRRTKKTVRVRKFTVTSTKG